MKILFVADVPLENPSSGSEQVLNQQAVGCAQDGMEVYAITRQVGQPPSWTDRTVEGIREVSYHASSQNMIRSFFSLTRYPIKFYRQFKKNIPFHTVICHQPFNLFSLLLRGNIKNIPLLYVFHSPSHEEYLLAHEKTSRLRNLPHAKARQVIEKFCIIRALKVMVLSRYMKQRLMEIHGIPAERIIVNPGGVDLDRFKPPQDRQKLKQGLNFPKGKIHLLTVRNLEPRMGLDNFLKCIHILKRNQADIHLTLAGEGIERKNLKKLIRELGLADTVTMTGFIKPGLLPKYYGASDFFILPTRCLEGFGLVTPESMSCGTPVLGTPIGGTKEILSHFDSRFLFKDASSEAMAEGIQNAIGEYLDQNEKYEELRIHCREYAVKNYSWKRHTDQLKTILDEMLINRSE
ncbi:MAG: glycosyltransferase family 4 protein [Desulfobacterales bacterium]|nr:glycosyltransferase family 4 protein [Desulfobacterales bacterium]